MGFAAVVRNPIVRPGREGGGRPRVAGRGRAITITASSGFPCGLGFALMRPISMDDLDLGATTRGLGPGQKVFNRYTLKRILGRGGMGVVWLAHDESLEQEVAIKVLPEIVAADPAAVRDLKRETRRSQQLSHPHILRI